MASVLPSRIAALNRLRCSLFQTSYNPTSQRTGAKYLRRRLQGPSMMQYYPQEFTIAQANKIIPGWNLIDRLEEMRLDDVEQKKKRGKGTPKKAKTAADSRRASRKR
ncbi:hypothetical protein EWM64_g7693 [Hericium alpestre]|uniref:Small ribosomal subunit protein mS33 n=1 Tax=Hericium alpestre TaxID=135208 RepID=A0A4Y9ZPZ7_9AGAM|nr:hypothetical protein EWM64_g7693 [Hericium alpestre]